MCAQRNHQHGYESQDNASNDCRLSHDVFSSKMVSILTTDVEPL
jgi:hypothetical protein